jgi:3-hydroxyisobutyrate dehydrogenase-like beta-hydroxyacid dehydrogenase
MEKIGILGYGNMGRAIAERIKEKYAVSVFDHDKNKTAALNNAC